MKKTVTLRQIREGDVSKIGFVGFGKSNAALAKILKEQKPTLQLTLRSDKEPENTNDVNFERVLFGKSAFSDIDEDIIFLSPSVRRDRPEIVSLLKRGVPISSDTELFLESFPYPVLAITGSDGKSTVTYLTSELTREELKSPPAGNFGLPLCTLLTDSKVSGAVAELSSFQLQYATPDVFRGIITNISENHLNWHKDFTEYIEAKEKLLKHAKEPMLFIGDAVCEALASRYPLHTAVSDTLTAEELLREYRCEHAVTLEDGHIRYDGERVISVDKIKRSEIYNVRNMMSAIALSRGYTERAVICELARTFTGLPHRCEHVLTRRGVSYINSSIDSTPKRTASTLYGFDTPSIVIIGGACKGLSYEPLFEAISQKARAVVLTGASTEALLANEELRKTGVPIIAEFNFEDAVFAAISLAESGDRVVLSPAHTSYDRFSSFEERGDYFKRIIKETVGDTPD